MSAHAKSMDKIAAQARKAFDIGPEDLLKVSSSKMREGGLKNDLAKQYQHFNKLFNNANKGSIFQEEVIKLAQRKYIDNLVEKGAKTQAARLSKKIAKTGTGYVIPHRWGGALGRTKIYKEGVIEPLAKRFGYKGAAIADRFANSALAFASVGLVSNKPGASLLDRAKDVPADMFLGGLFASAGVPTILGKWGKHAGKAETLGLLAIGSYQDYLTFKPDPNLDIKDRLLHGLGLVAFHHVGLGLSNIGVKDKMFNGLIDMGFEPPVAYEMAYSTKFTKDAISISRKWYQKNGSIYVNKKNNQDVISISEFVSEKIAADKEQTGFIKYIGVGSDKSGTFSGKNIKDARKKLNNKYKKVDFTDKKLMDDLPPEVRANKDSILESLQSEYIEIGGKKKYQLSGQAAEPTAREITERRYNIEQKRELDFYQSQRKDLENVATKNRIFDSERDVKEIIKERQYEKGDLVEWVKDGKEMNVTAEGDFYPVKVQKLEGDYVYINLKGSTVPESIGREFQMQEARIPLSETKMVTKTGGARAKTSEYKLTLRYSNKKDGSHHRKFKETSWDDPNNLIFESREAAERYAMENWVGQFEGNPSIAEKIKLLKAREGRLTSSQEYKTLAMAKDKINRAFQEKGFQENEIKEVLKVMSPESKGKIDNMTVREIKKTTDLIKGDDSISFDVFDNRVRLEPTNLASKINPKFGKVLKTIHTKAKEIIFGTSAIGDMFGGYGADMSLRQRNAARFRNATMGVPVELINQLRRDLKWTGVGLKDINKHIHAILDPITFGAHRNSSEFKIFEKKLQNFKLKDAKGDEVSAIDAIMSRMEKFHDEMAVAQIISNSYIRDASTKTLKRVPFWKAYDMQGNKIEIVDIYKNFELHQKQVRSILNWMKSGNKNAVVWNQNNKLVRIDTRKKLNIREQYRDEAGVLKVRKKVIKNPSESKHYYTKDYYKRKITEEFFDFINVPDGKALDKAALYMAKNDLKLKELPFDEAFNIARQTLKDIQKINNKNNIYGQQYTRIADLPAYMYIAKGRDGWGDIIQITKDIAYKSNGKPFEVGETILDANNIPHTVGKRIKVYDTNYIDVLNDYSSKIAHSTSTYYAWGKNGNINNTIGQISEGLSRQVGDLYYRDWSKKIMEAQIYGEKQGAFGEFMRPITRWSAIAGLSSPLSGLKNLFLGNVQNISVFTGRELWKAYLSRNSGLLNPLGEPFTKWKSSKQYAEKIGATYQSSFDLHLEAGPTSGFIKRWLPNLGLMRTTEILNRTIASSIGPYSAQIHIANMAMKKNPATKGVSLNDSRRILKDVLEFTPQQIDNLVKRYKSEVAKYIEHNPKDKKLKGFDFRLNDAEMKQAAQQAHVITQGSGDLPYIPYWMGRGWAKPLTLFYKVAYRITDTVAKNVVKPAIVDGNLVPSMKYIGLSTLSGMTLYSAYDFLFDEQRVNKFKDLPSQFWDYFLKAEGLALFSNASNEYGGFEEAYYPVPLRNIEVVWDNLVDWVQGKKFGTTALGDGMKEIVAVYGTAEKIIKRATKQNVKQYDDSKRRQYQFLDTYYPKENINIEYEDGITSKTPHYRVMKDVFWYDNPDIIAKKYYSSLAMLSHIIMEEKGWPYPMAEKEARSRLKSTISSLRPIPKSWAKQRGKTGKSLYMEYINALSNEERRQEDDIMSIYNEKYKQFYRAIINYKNKYYKKG